MVHAIEARPCAGCGQAFIPRRRTQTRCKKACGRSWAGIKGGGHKARAEKRAAPTDFIGIDGEGVTDPVTGNHSYVLLGCGEHSLSIDGLHLDFLDILEFLWGCFKQNPHAAYVGFYLGYDFGQWVRTLPAYEGFWLMKPEGGVMNRKGGLWSAKDGEENKIVVPTRRPRLGTRRDPFPVQYEDWEFDYLPNKRFRFRPRTPRGQKGGPYMNICDAGSFFQSSFLKAIDPKVSKSPVVTPAEHRIILEGKRRRDHAEFDPAMVRYNQLECEVLARLMRQHDEGIRAAELRLDRAHWFGPGQVANAWFKKIGMLKGADMREVTPEAVRDAARGAYFGGWFETFWHGPREGTSYGYDINSAYVAVMAELPCLLHGEWRHFVEKPAGVRLTRPERGDLENLRFALIRAEVEGEGPPQRIGAMLHRRANRWIIRPRKTRGWYWAHELAAACAASFVRQVRVFETWVFEQHCEHKPLAGLAELYKGRLAVGKNTPAGRAAKLIYNSGYGKLTQSVGTPVWSNPVYASAIPAGCRTMVTQAIASHPEGVTCILKVATDGVIFSKPHPGLDLDDERLGAWTANTHENLSIFMPGVYWDDATRAAIAKGDAPVFKSRGFPAKDFRQHIQAMDDAWERMARRETDEWPRAVVPISFQLVSPKQAIMRGDWSLCGTVTKNADRTINANPNSRKRTATKPGWSLPFSGDYDRVKNEPVIDSLPYDGTFGDELREREDIEWGDHPDGDIQGLIRREVFGGK